MNKEKMKKDILAQNYLYTNAHLPLYECQENISIQTSLDLINRFIFTKFVGFSCIIDCRRLLNSKQSYEIIH